jgi:hypothetical protein
MEPRKDVEDLSADLEAACARALFREWRQLNWTHFASSLRAPVVAIDDSDRRLGSWSRSDRSIRLSRRLVLEQPWGVVVEVLKHEMAHQYVEEVLGQTQETGEAPHGEAFRRTCERLGIDVRAAGMPVAGGGGGDGRVLGRVAKLLALAGSPNVHEAELAMREAQRLMLAHNIDVARSGAARGAYGFRHLGEPTGRVQLAERVLASILCTHFFVEVIWVTVYRPRVGTRGTVLEVCGTDENLALAEYVHGFLRHTGERLWREHRRREGIRSDRDRRSYLAGVMRGFRDRLDEERGQQEAAGLVWVGDGDLKSYHSARHPRQVSTGRRRTTSAAAFGDGRAAGRGIVLARPLASQGGTAGRLLLK